MRAASAANSSQRLDLMIYCTGTSLPQPSSGLACSRYPGSSITPAHLYPTELRESCKPCCDPVVTRIWDGSHRSAEPHPILGDRFPERHVSFASHSHHCLVGFRECDGAAGHTPSKCSSAGSSPECNEFIRPSLSGTRIRLHAAKLCAELWC